VKKGKPVMLLNSMIDRIEEYEDCDDDNDDMEAPASDPWERKEKNTQIPGPCLGLPPLKIKLGKWEKCEKNCGK
jgi:hypothetical protein